MLRASSQKSVERSQKRESRYAQNGELLRDFLSAQILVERYRDSSSAAYQSKLVCESQGTDLRRKSKGEPGLSARSESR